MPRPLAHQLARGTVHSSRPAVTKKSVGLAFEHTKKCVRRILVRQVEANGL